MNIEMLKSKLHQACITDGDVDYEGSFGVDVQLMDAVGFYPNEKVLVANLGNGNRFETYLIAEPFGSRRIVLNGAAALLGQPGDRVIIMSFGWIEESVVRSGRYAPRVLRLDEHNEPLEPYFAFRASEEIAAMLEG